MLESVSTVTQDGTGKLVTCLSFNDAAVDCKSFDHVNKLWKPINFAASSSRWLIFVYTYFIFCSLLYLLNCLPIRLLLCLLLCLLLLIVSYCLFFCSLVYSFVNYVY
jgi:hypothetical protein